MKLDTLRDAILYFSDPGRCREYMIALRWPDGVECPRCGSANVLFLEKYNRWHCREKHPSPQFTLKTGTVMEDSAIGLEKWLPGFWLLANCKNGISSYELHRALGVTQKSAWFMLHRIRLAMRMESGVKMGGPNGGAVESDETFIGGNPKNMHKSRRLAIQRKRSEVADWKASHKHSEKIPVMGMLDRESRQVRAKVVPNVKRETLQNEILDQVERGSKVYTDQAGGYLNLAAQQYVHETVTHVQEYVRGEVHTNGLENFWSLLKRTLRGTYVAVEPFHLDGYVSEQVFRYNNRTAKDNPLNDADRFALAVSQIPGKRLTYAELTGKVGETGEAF
ncbi:MAG TPA: IS1595 family transposase [Acidobacteriaceae bacterium]|jgi:transposase-like protein|nr:IS1595 family transposase [Acidobacteriaceae bacterium]